MSTDVRGGTAHLGSVDGNWLARGAQGRVSFPDANTVGGAPVCLLLAGPAAGARCGPSQGGRITAPPGCESQGLLWNWKTGSPSYRWAVSCADSSRARPRPELTSRAGDPHLPHTVRTRHLEQVCILGSHARQPRAGADRHVPRDRGPGSMVVLLPAPYRGGLQVRPRDPSGKGSRS